MFMQFLQSPAPLVIAACLYVAQAYGYAAKGDGGMSVTLLAYAMANMGMVYSFLTMGAK